MLKKLGRLIPLVTASAALCIGLMSSVGYIQLSLADDAIIGLLALLAIDALGERLSMLEQINAKLERLSNDHQPPGEVTVEVQKEGDGMVFKIRGPQKSA